MDEFLGRVRRFNIQIEKMGRIYGYGDVAFDRCPACNVPLDVGRCLCEERSDAAIS